MNLRKGEHPLKKTNTKKANEPTKKQLLGTEPLMVSIESVGFEKT